METLAFEMNFDGLPGPTHNYAGLSYGNVASIRHGLTISNPRAALTQGLAKMKLLADMGLEQGVLPPQERPDLATLRRLGFRGSDDRIVEKAAKEAPELLAACYSSSAMWAANAATVSPSADTADGRVHFTPANLVSQFHRSLEPPFTAVALKAIFDDESRFVHHPPIPAGLHFSDEGAANHTRLCADYRARGIELFAYGRSSFDPSDQGPEVFPARQTKEASSAVARLHGLDPARTLFARQNPKAVDVGVFHNDVISVGNQNVFLYHEQAFHRSPAVAEELTKKFEEHCRGALVLIPVKPGEITLREAVESYFFNSQLVTLPDGKMLLIAPAECREINSTRTRLERIVEEENPIESVQYTDLRQSMKNGGGPACLRLRVVLTEEELSCVHQGVYFTDKLYHELTDWGNRHYRDRLGPEDLADPALVNESRAALDELAEILRLDSLYAFRRGD
jgi:succinylarginine dihydrolase